MHSVHQVVTHMPERYWPSHWREVAEAAYLEYGADPQDLKLPKKFSCEVKLTMAAEFSHTKRHLF